MVANPEPQISVLRPTKRGIKLKTGRSVSLRNVLALQGLIYDTAFKGCKPSDLAQLARSWDVLEERKRILRGKPLPGHLQPGKEPKRIANPVSLIALATKPYQQSASDSSTQTEPLSESSG